MKIYEWTWNERKGTLTANNTGEAKEALVKLLRAPGDKSVRVPKGTVIKKIGLVKGKAAKPAVEEEQTHNEKRQEAIENIKTPKLVYHKVDPNASLDFKMLPKDTTFSNCKIKLKDGGTLYIGGDGAELVLPKGTDCCKLPA